MAERYDVDLKLFHPALDQLLNNPDGKVGRMLKRKGDILVILAKSQVGVKTGALKASIHMRHYRDGRGQYIKVGSSLQHALVHHEGSRPHLIRPNKAQVLRFSKQGRMITTRLVRHPGTKPNHYLTRNLRTVIR